MINNRYICIPTSYITVKFVSEIGIAPCIISGLETQQPITLHGAYGTSARNTVPARRDTFTRTINRDEHRPGSKASKVTRTNFRVGQGHRILRFPTASCFRNDESSYKACTRQIQPYEPRRLLEQQHIVQARRQWACVRRQADWLPDCPTCVSRDRLPLFRLLERSVADHW